MHYTAILLLSSILLAANLPANAYDSLEEAADRLIEASESTSKSTTNATEDVVQEVADSEITAEVKTKIFLDDNIPSSITVTTLNGVVYLKGKVSTQADKELAIKLTKEVNGVKRVDSSGLTVYN